MLIVRVPGSKCANYKSKNLAFEASGNEMIFERGVFVDLLLFRFCQGFGSIVKRTTNIYDSNLISFRNDDVWAEARVGFCNGAVCGNFSRTYRVRESFYYFVTALADQDHIETTVIMDMWKGFIIHAVATTKECVRSARFVGIQARTVETDYKSL